MMELDLFLMILVLMQDFNARKTYSKEWLVKLRESDRKY